MGSASANYIRNYLEDGTAVGVVKFSSTATVLADMTVIVNETTRDTLVNVVPTTVGGGTGIGAGMLKCGEVSYRFLCSAVLASKGQNHYWFYAIFPSQ